ncbi:MAG: PAS domain-containing protein [Bacteroidales bacterium]|nr:PAS domain-containing protein [Bacteroidales bacterium]
MAIRQKKLTNKNKDFIIVGIGASAGGLEAIQDLFKFIPEKSGMAYVVIQHLSPDYKSLMDELLARHTNIPIQIATDGMDVLPDNIYLIPPRKNLKVFHNKIFLENQSLNKGLNLPVDVFFRSLAAEKGKNAVGIILSGTGSDGTLGTRAIKEAGGVVLVQDELSAKFNGMPKSSISTGLVDFVTTPSLMAEALINFVKHPFTQNPKPIESILDKNVDTLTKITLILRDYSGIDFSYYKENTIIRRLERRVSINRFNNLEQYLSFLSESDKEKETLFRELLIGVTRFFRDSEAFNSLEKNVLPNLDLSQGKTIRIWSAGCSTGEEVYSLAILCNEYLSAKNLKCDIKIFATDIDKHSLELAGIGFYPDSILSDLEPALLAKYFTRKEGGYQINELIRKMVVFATHNLLKDPPFSKLDLLICRNLFIYLKPDIQTKILSSFYYSLNSGGYLFLGSSETLGEINEGFETVDSKWRIYKYKSGFRPLGLDSSPIVQHISDYKSTAQIKTRTPELNTINKILENLLVSFVPPSVIVDENHNIIHVINNVAGFLAFQPGRFSGSVLDNMHKDLSLFVSAMLRKLKRETTSIISERISGLHNFPDKIIVLEGRKILLDGLSYYMITFIVENEDKVGSNAKSKTLKVESFNVSKIADLEKELQFAKENLQATVEELETSNEELQSSNEELIASNEELQSTNEELQSVNEELYTVNSEHQIKIDELIRINNDINNLLKNTEIGALYLDVNLCIRKITPVVSKITNILQNDLGRPLTHLAPMDSYPQMQNDVIKVSENLQPLDKEIICDDKNFLVRIRPYRTEYNAVEGILLTFVDITNIKDLQKDLVKEKLFFQATLDQCSQAKLVLDNKGIIIFANKMAEEFFAIEQEKLKGKTLDSNQCKFLTSEKKPIAGKDNPVLKSIKTGTPLINFKHIIVNRLKIEYKVIVNVTTIKDSDNLTSGVVVSLETC